MSKNGLNYTISITENCSFPNSVYCLIGYTRRNSLLLFKHKYPFPVCLTLLQSWEHKINSVFFFKQKNRWVVNSIFCPFPIYRFRYYSEFQRIISIFRFFAICSDRFCGKNLRNYHFWWDFKARNSGRIPKICETLKGKKP